MQNFKLIPPSEILSILDGIEGAPRMYGGLEAVEVLYVTLLSLLCGFEKMQTALSHEANLAAGFETNLALYVYKSTHVDLIVSLKRIRQRCGA